MHVHLEFGALGLNVHRVGWSLQALGDSALLIWGWLVIAILCIPQIIDRVRVRVQTELDGNDQLGWELSRIRKSAG